MRPVRQLVWNTQLAFPTPRSFLLLPCWHIATFCVLYWCLQSFWRIIFTASRAIEMKCLPGFVPYSSDGLVGSLPSPMQTNLRLVPPSRLSCAHPQFTDFSQFSLWQNDRELGEGGRRGRGFNLVWTVNGLASVCFASMTMLSQPKQSQLTARCSILSSQFPVPSSQLPAHRSQLPVPSSLNVKQHKVIDG